MSTPNTSAELALINDAQFLEELQQTDFSGRAGDPGFAARPLYNDAYDALEDGLPVRAGVPAIALPVDDPHQDAAPYEPYTDPPPAAPVETGIPLFTAMIVIVACLTAGAATAAYVFHDSLSRINVTSIRPASR